VTVPPCRSCGSLDVETVLSLGETPLANSLVAPEHVDEPEPTFPLDLAFCPSCSLVQITETVPPDVLFRDYVYFSSYSDTMLRHAADIADELVAERGLGPKSLVVEAASNDGYLLAFYRERGVRVLGIEPARNVAAVAEERGIPTIAEFFDSSLAERLVDEGMRANVFHAHNVLAHVAGLNDFVTALSTLLAEDGIAVIEVPYVKDMLDRCEFDTIYHEHLCYFSVTALDALVGRHGLALVDVGRVPIHGGSLRLRVAHEGASEPSPMVSELLAEEQRWGVADVETYRAFAAKVRGLEGELLGLLQSLRSSGARIAGYGAAAKGSTLLNVFGIGPETVEFVVDRSTQKQGRYMPGVRIPIGPPERLLTEMPDYVLLLAWNLADEVVAQQADYRRRGGRFIVPVPVPEVLDP
jgi:SAM-dependent methyltransferase